MHRKKFRLCILLILFITSVFLIPLTLSKYFVSYDRTITLNITKPTYTVVFHSNDGNDNTSTQSFVYGTAQNLNANSFVNGNAAFDSWNTAANGSGTSYQDEESVINLSSVNNDQIDLYAQWITGVAEMDGVYYPTIHDAVNAVTAGGGQKTINLLADLQLDTTDRISVTAGKEIIFNLQNHTVRNVNQANTPLIENSGTIIVQNGTLISNAAQAAINNNRNASITINNLSISATGAKQGVYNDGGYVEIKGSTTISATSSDRAAVQNQSGGTLIIREGTITSTRFYGVQNAGSLSIGTSDGTVSRTNPTISGTYGVYSTSNFSFYDGILRGTTDSVNNFNKVATVETGYQKAQNSDVVGTKIYQTLYLATDVVTITLDPNGGTLSNTSRKVERGASIGILPTPDLSGSTFDDWYDDPTSGNRILPTTIITANDTYYAHYVQGVAEYDGTFYSTLADAMAAVQTSNQVTIYIHKDLTANFSVPSTMNVIFDMQGHKFTNGTNQPVISNDGILTLRNGTVASSAGYGAINNNPGATLYVEDFNIEATGTRQCIYNDAATATISGNSLLTNTASERGAVQNQSGSTLYILGGTIRSYNYDGVDNRGTLELGTSGSGIDSTSPVIIGARYGVRNTSTFSFYDGIIKGKSSANNGSINAKETGSSYVTGTEIIDSDTYNYKYLTL